MNPVSGPHLSPDDFDGWLSGALAPDAREHLDRCPDCRERADAEREIVALLGSLPLMGPAPDFADRVMHAVILPDPFSLRSLADIRRKVLASPRSAAFAATVALLLVGSMTASIVWSLGHRETLMAVGSWVAAEAWQAGWVALRGVASNLMEQPWYAALRGSLEHPAWWGALSALASLAYVLGVVAFRRLLALPTSQVAHADL
jgi:hypothetical protein